MNRSELILNLIGENTISNYTFLNNSNNVDKLGEGGSGYILVANQNMGENASVKRAVKFFVFKDELWEENGIVSNNNFLSEIVNISRLSHQNIIKVIDGNLIVYNMNEKTYKIPYIVTELIEGYDAENIFNDNNKDKAKKIFKNEDVIFNFFLQIIDGIGYLHKNLCYHCDIAPKNIFIKENNDGSTFAILGDLGLATFFEDSTNLDSEISVLGTRKYMPNNVARIKNEKVSKKEFKKLQPAWDIYSTIMSLIEIIDNIKNLDSEKFAQMWNLNLLYEKLKKILNDTTSIKTIDKIKNEIEVLQPNNNKILSLEEISEASSGIGQKLIPVSPAFLSYRVQMLTRSDIMLRLNDVTQLFTGTTIFPGANHTRYEHSLGTYELMRKTIISLMRNSEYRKFFSIRNIVVGLLAALLSSLDCFPYSHAFSELLKQGVDIKTLKDSEIFKYYINFSNEKHESLWSEIIHLFGEYNIQLSEIEYVIYGKTKEQEYNKELQILHIILNSSIGVRVVDYLIRDAYHIGMEYTIDIEYLIKSMTIKDDNFYLSQKGVVHAEQIISNRYWMYKRIYWNEPSRFNMALMKNIIYHSIIQDESVCEKIQKKSVNCTYNDILNILYEANNQKLEIRKDIDFIRQKGKERYRNLLFFGRSSSFPDCNNLYNKFIELTYEKQDILRQKIEEKIIEYYELPKDTIYDLGTIILLDCPIGNNKTGTDIEIVRFDKSTIKLDEVSKVVSGVVNAFEKDLKLIRIFAHPVIYKKIINEDSRKYEEVQTWLYSQLRDLL